MNKCSVVYDGIDKLRASDNGEKFNELFRFESYEEGSTSPLDSKNEYYPLFESYEKACGFAKKLCLNGAIQRYQKTRPGQFVGAKVEASLRAGVAARVFLKEIRDPDYPAYSELIEKGVKIILIYVWPFPKEQAIKMLSYFESNEAFEADKLGVITYGTGYQVVEYK